MAKFHTARDGHYAPKPAKLFILDNLQGALET